MLLQLHTWTLFCSASESLLCTWSRSSDGTSHQFLLFPGKFEIMASLKAHSSSWLSSCAVSGSSVSGDFFFWKQWFPSGCLWRCHQDLDSVLLFLFPPQGFSNFIDKVTPNPCFMEITDKSSTPDPDIWMETPFYLRPIPTQNLGLFLRDFFTNLWLSLPAQDG